MRAVVTERAERATRELMFSYSAHLQSRRRHLASRGRYSSYDHWFESPTQLTLPHFAAVCEEFSRSVLIECSAPIVHSTHPLLEKLWAAAAAKAETWPGQEEAWREWHDINIAKEAAYKNVRPVIEARNAVVHGLGNLTRRQTQKGGGASVKRELATVGIHTSGRQLVVDDAAVRKCVEVARDFITWLDLETQARNLRALTATVES